MGEQKDDNIILEDNRETDKRLTDDFFHLSKVRQIIWCGEFLFPRAVYSILVFGRDKGPTQYDKDII